MVLVVFIYRLNLEVIFDLVNINIIFNPMRFGTRPDFMESLFLALNPMDALELQRTSS